MGKESPGGTTSAPRIVGSFVRALALILYLDCRGTCRAQPKLAPKLTLIEPTYPGGSEKGIAITSTQILADQVHSCSVQVVIPASGFAHLQSQVGGIPWPGKSVGCTSAWLGSTKEEFCWCSSPVCPHQARKMRHGPTLYGECLLAPPDRKASNNPWKLYGPSALDHLRSNSRRPVQSWNLGYRPASVKGTNKEIYRLWSSFFTHVSTGNLIHHQNIAMLIAEYSLHSPYPGNQTKHSGSCAAH